VDIRSAGIRRAISAGTREFKAFCAEFKGVFDLGHSESIRKVYDKAVCRGVFEHARSLRNLIFGTDIRFYGVCYLWDHCVNRCAYCPGSVDNRRKTGYLPSEMSIHETVEDVNAVLEDGHTHVCFLSGEDPRNHPPALLARYLRKLDTLGLDEIILNVPPVTDAGFRVLRESVVHTPLQFRVFQETYNREAYRRLHPGGPKRDYGFRIESQQRALEAGFNNVGLGALFGLHRYPIEEIEALMRHAYLIETRYGRQPIRVCLPSANFLPNIDVDIPWILEKGTYDAAGNLLEVSDYELFDELIYALARLAMPHISLVSSERDPADVLKILDDYATCTVLNVHPGVGDNIRHHCGIKMETVHFEQATSFSREPLPTLDDMRLRGFNPVINEERINDTYLQSQNEDLALAVH
jgi:2-iminoacetate synthase